MAARLPRIAQARKYDGRKKIAFFTVLDFPGLSALGSPLALRSGNGPAKAAVVRVRGATAILITAAFHAVPTLFFALELHNSAPEIMLYYSNPEEFARDRSVDLRLPYAECGGRSPNSGIKTPVRESKR
jgi:hypothetical protein